jgi:hypothetical protein|tara:strand:+ start:1481 stop:2245 length:765 start_codon:yes stop_codon:yes gene_type:complete
MLVRKIKNVEHKVYSNEEEFSQYCPNENLTRNWRDGTEGSWVTTDDGQICQVLRRGELKNSQSTGVCNYYVRTAIGTFLCKDNVEMSGELRKNMYSFGSDKLSLYQQKIHRKKPTRREFLFAKYVAQGDGIAEAFMKAYPTNNEKYADYQGKILLSTERIKGLIREEVDKVLHEAEITPLYLLERMKEVVDNEGSQDKDKIQAIKTLMQISGMMETEKRTESLTLFQGFTKDQLNAIQGGDSKKLIEASREVEK